MGAAPGPLKPTKGRFTGTYRRELIWALGAGCGGRAGTRHKYWGHEHGGTGTERGGTADSNVNVTRENATAAQYDSG